MPQTEHLMERERSPRQSSKVREMAEMFEHAGHEELDADKAGIVDRLRAQGAVRVFPGGGSTARSEPDEAAPQEEVVESGPVDENDEWSSLPTRERSGGRKQDESLQEDLHTRRFAKQLAPGMFDIRQKAKNALTAARNNPEQTAAGMIPLVGKLASQKIGEKYDVKERDLMRGIAKTSQDESISKDAATQSSAVGKKVKKERAVAAFGTLLGAGSEFIPIAGSGVSMAGGMIANSIGDAFVRDELQQVVNTRAREKARKHLGGKEYADYAGFDEFHELETQRKELTSVGRGKQKSASSSIESQDDLRRIVAHTRGETPHYKDMKAAYKYNMEQRATNKARQEKEERNQSQPQSGGLLSRFKGFFGGS